MAAIIVKNTPTKRSQQEALDLIAGAGAVRLVQATETFVASIKAIVPNEDSTITELLADDGLNTDVVANTDPTDLNLAGATLGTGAYIIPHTYEVSKGFTSVTCGTGSIWAYYNDTIDNIGL